MQVFQIIDVEFTKIIERRRVIQEEMVADPDIVTDVPKENSVETL